MEAISIPCVALLQKRCSLLQEDATGLSLALLGCLLLSRARACVGKTVTAPSHRRKSIHISQISIATLKCPRSSIMRIPPPVEEDVSGGGVCVS